MTSFNPMIPVDAFTASPESVPMSKEPSQLMRFKNIHSMVANEMARKASHLSEVYTGAPVAPTTDADTQLPSPPPPSPCLSPSSVHSASDDQPSSHPTDMLPMTPLTPHGELSEMTKELLSFWEEIEPTNSNESLKLNYRLSLLVNNSNKQKNKQSEKSHRLSDITDESAENSPARISNELLDSFLEPDNKWFLNINVDLLTDDDDLINSINSMGGSNNTNSSGVRPQSSVELNSQRESEEMLLWSSLPSPPPLVPVTARLRSSRSIHARPVTSYDLTTPNKAKELLGPITEQLDTPNNKNEKTKLSLSPKFITWSTKTLVKRQKSNSPPNSGKSKDDATSGDKSELLNQVGRGRSKSVSTTKEMSTMVSDHRGHQPDSTVNKLSDMFALKKDQSDSAGLKPIIVQPDAFPDGNGIVFKKKSVLKRIFSGRKNRQHPESNTRYNNNNSDCYMRERSESAPVDFSDNAPIRPDPLAEISNYERIMRSNSKQRFNKARWSVQGSGLDVRDYQTILLPSEAAQLRRDYLVKKIRENQVSQNNGLLSPPSLNLDGSSVNMVNQPAVRVSMFNQNINGDDDYDESEWLDDEEMEQLETDRRKAVFNLIRCEQKHLRGLVLLKGAFADPLRKVLQQQVEQTSTEVFTEEKLDCIFACAIKTIQFHKMFLRDLERAIKEHAQTGTLENAYNAFNNHMPGFRFYLHYMKQYPDMMATFDELYSSNQLFRRTLEECAEQVEHINIRALLSNPLEHITHYHTFLQKILELYSYEDPEYHGFMKCVKQIRQIKSESAKLARTVRQGEEVRQVQASLKGLTMPLATPTRQLIYQGNLSQMMMLTDKTKQRVCFLFNDLLVFAKEKDGGQLYYKGHIDLEAASVLEVPSDQIANAFVIMDKVDRSFYFQAETPNFWRQWIEHLNQTLGNPQVITATGSNMASSKVDRPVASPDSEFNFFN